MVIDLFLWGLFVLLLTMIIGIAYYRTESFLVENFGSSCLDLIPFNSPSSKQITKPNTIFVSVASYRDHECSVTIESIYKNADHPERIFVGICEQNKEGEKNEECVSPSMKKYESNIRMKRLDYTQAKGPTYARYYCAEMWDGEEYFLQIDSHTTFQPHWDTELIKMFQEIINDPNESDYPVLSVYPPTEDQINLKGFPEMDNGRIAENGLPIFLCGWADQSSKPKRSNKPWAAGGFMFLKGDFLREVPFDPNLSGLFQGEESLLSARLFTNGYDFYTPNKNIAYHHYARDGPMYYKDIKDTHICRNKAEQRVKFLLGVGSKKSIADEFVRDLHNYGMGSFRNVKDWWKASGMNYKQKEVEKWNDKNPPSSKYNGWWFRRDGYQNIKKR